MRRALILAATLTLTTAAACAGGPQAASPFDWDTQPHPGDAPTLAFENRGMEVIQLTRHGQTIGRIDPGQTRCFRLPEGVRQDELVIRLPGRRAYPVLNPNMDSHPGWQMEIGHNPRTEVMTLEPTAPCQ